MEVEGSEGMNRSRMDSVIVLLVYVARAYRYMQPYVKGLNLTLDSCGNYRDEEG